MESFIKYKIQVTGVGLGDRKYVGLRLTFQKVSPETPAVVSVSQCSAWSCPCGP